MPIVPLVTFIMVGSLTATNLLSVDAEPGCTNVLLNTGSTGIPRRHEILLILVRSSRIANVRLSKDASSSLSSGSSVFPCPPATTKMPSFGVVAPGRRVGPAEAAVPSALLGNDDATEEVIVDVDVAGGVLPAYVTVDPLEGGELLPFQTTGHV